MDDNLISITMLNDFIFCPISIYFHNLYGEADRTLYQSADQINGSAAHNSIDNQKYSSKSNILQGISVYCDKYGLVGKIDVFDVSKGILTERKRSIKEIYDGYVFQLYAQYYGLIELGYSVNKLQLHSVINNRTYSIVKPEDDIIMFGKFEKVINDIRTFKIELFEQSNKEKCAHCIYEPACDCSLDRSGLC